VVIEVDSADGPVLAVIEHEPWVEASPITLHGEFVAAVSLGEEIGVVFRRGARNYLQVLRSGMSGWHLDERTIHLPGADLSSVDAVVRN
jgi:hypothetical protein